MSAAPTHLKSFFLMAVPKIWWCYGALWWHVLWCVGLELARKTCEKLGEGFAYHVIFVSLCQHRSHEKCKAITSKRVTRYTFTLTHLEGRGLHAPPSNFAEKAIRARRVRSCRCLHAQIRLVCTTTTDTLQVNPFRVDPFSSGGSTPQKTSIFYPSSTLLGGCIYEMRVLYLRGLRGGVVFTRFL